MAKFFRSILFVAAAMLFAACSNPSGGDDGLDKNPEPTPKSKVTLTYDRNQPEVNGSLSYLVDTAVPLSEIKDEGSIFTAASFDGKLVEYENNEEMYKYSFVEWNTKTDGSGLAFKAGDSFQLDEDRVLYAIYSDTPDQNDDFGNDNADALDFAVTKRYKMNVGDTVSVVSEMDGVGVLYIVQGTDGVVFVDNSTMIVTALSVGTQIVEVYTWDDVKLGSCVFEVTAEGFDGNEIEYKVIGKWNYDDDNVSYLKFNADKTGEMLVYLRGNKVQDCTFDWSAFKATNGRMYLSITDGPDYINTSYEISFSSANSLHLIGYLAVFAPHETNWTKE